jgi:hypothetical protein
MHIATYVVAIPLTSCQIWKCRIISLRSGRGWSAARAKPMCEGTSLDEEEVRHYLDEFIAFLERQHVARLVDLD